MEFKRFLVNFTILDYVWKPFFKVMKYNKPIGRVYNIFIGPIFINIIKKQISSNNKATMAIIKEKFKKLYGDREIELPSNVLTINDSYASPFSSGSNGYLTKVRLNKDNFEFYHNWWSYGWISFDEVKEKYPCAACKVESLINHLIK